jgi:PhnB protein
MTKQVKAIREGLHSVTPHLVLNDAAAAIEFYKKAFGAEEVARMPAPDGKLIWHAEIRIGSSMVYLNDEAVAMGLKSAKTLGASPVTLQLNVEDANGAFKRATDAGATVKMPLMDMFWGDRYGQVSDPFGYDWGISQRIKDLTPEELAKASAEAAKQYGAK